MGVLPPTFQRTMPGAIWLHAVSVGEVLSCVELVKRLRVLLPSSSIFVSCGTLSGREAAEAKLSELVDGTFFVPLDFVFAIRAVLRRLRPAVVVVLETEIWPNLYREVRRSGVGLLVANGRISAKALGQYTRAKWFFREVLSLPHRILAQSSVDREHYLAAGASPRVVELGGNLKYDFQRSEVLAPELEQWLGGTGRLWIAASTVGPEFEGDVDEDDAVIAAYALLPANVRLLIAPRKPERFDLVAAKWSNAGAAFGRRSQLSGSPRVLLLDSIGELGAVFPFADVVFVGGTLAHRGGHNLLEPALCGKPVIVGPHLENFAEIQQVFREGKGFVEITGAAELGTAVSRLLLDDEGVGARGKALAEAQRGATDRAVAEIVKLRWDAVPINPASLLQPLAALWDWGGRAKRAVTKTQRLRTPVVSVGGLAMGGVGKTPMVLHLAKLLPGSAVLTRGYRRDSKEQVTVLEAGLTAPIAVTGDEAQLYLRAGLPVGIGGDRHAAGLAAEQRFHPRLFLMDDGFQHARLHRDFDLVLLDGLDPLAGGLFPVGRLREPLQALRRADAIVITRSTGNRYSGLLREVRAAGASAPVFYSHVVPEPLWIEGPVVAFCGLANPETFRQTLERHGLTITHFHAFPDHHRYSPSDMAALKKYGLPLVTTEKDAVKLPLHFAQVLRISIRIDDEDALLAMIMSKCNALSRQESLSS